MAVVNIFVSFEFDKDVELQNNFYEQAKTKCPHRIRDKSLHESYPTDEWKGKAREAIRQCDVVIVLIGQDTHEAPGVKVETDMARSLGKPVFQVKPKKRTYNGIPHLGTPIPWKWKRINKKLAELFPNR